MADVGKDRFAAAVATATLAIVKACRRFSLNRAELLNELAEKLDRLHLGRPVRVAIDGRTASGKTSLADELAAALLNHKRPIIRTSIDGFHRPRSERYARGRYSGEGYYHDARDLSAIVDRLLAPLGPSGDRRYRTASFDLDADLPLDQEPQTAAGDAILIVDGTFLQRLELRDHWDATVFVRTSLEVSEFRGLRRDMTSMGGEEQARKVYSLRYHPAYALYDQLCAPERHSDAIIDNDDLAYPRLQIRPNGRLAS